MEGNWDNAYAKEQLWVLRDIQDAVTEQLLSVSSYNCVAGDNAELSVALPLGAQEERTRDPNILIPEKLESLKRSILEKVSLFIRYRVGCDLDFSSSLIYGLPEGENQSQNNLEERALLFAMAENSLQLQLPVALNQYSYLHVLSVCILKYLNDLEYIRRVSTKKMPPLPQYDKDNKNRYDKLRYKFHRYKVQFMLATQHLAMGGYNRLRMIGWRIIDKTFEDINAKSTDFIQKYCQLTSPNQTDVETNTVQVNALYEESFQHLKGQLLNFLQIFGIRMVNREEGNRLVPEEFPAYWIGNVPTTAAVRVESEDSMYLNGEDAGDEVSVSQNVPGDIPHSSGYYSDDSNSGDSDLEEPIGGYSFLDNPMNHDWMNEPSAKRRRRF